MGKNKDSRVDVAFEWLIHLENQYLHGDMTEEFYLLQLEKHCPNFYSQEGP